VELIRKCRDFRLGQGGANTGICDFGWRKPIGNLLADIA